jgi:tRNA (cytidine/uridine-2'-O-)-methyltransferase
MPPILGISDGIARHLPQIIVFAGLIARLSADAITNLHPLMQSHSFGTDKCMRLALYHPEIPGNVGAILRLSACFGVSVDIIEPCGFVFSDTRLRRAGMDYIDHVDMVRHKDWEDFYAQVTGRVILMTTKAGSSLFDFEFEANDILLFGQESAGAPDHVHKASDGRLCIPLRPGLRSFNVSMAAGIALAEGLRQTGGLPV